MPCRAAGWHEVEPRNETVWLVKRHRIEEAELLLSPGLAARLGRPMEAMEFFGLGPSQVHSTETISKTRAKAVGAVPCDVGASSQEGGSGCKRLGDEETGFEP